jgi:hypothetical protein
MAAFTAVASRVTSSGRSYCGGLAIGRTTVPAGDGMHRKRNVGPGWGSSTVALPGRGRAAPKKAPLLLSRRLEKLGTLRIRCAVVISAASALLAACGGGSRQQIAPVIPVTNPAVNAHSADLLYVSNGSGVVNVYRYWQRSFHQKLTGFKAPKGECVDADGDVYITDSELKEIFEYRHDATKPVRIIKEFGYRPYACSVDFATGNLAVANKKSGSAGNIAIYASASGTPKIYKIRYLPHPMACGYDNQGNLFVASVEHYSGYPYANFAYLPKGEDSFVNVRLPYLTSSYPFALISNLQWDGTYWAVENDADIFRYSIDRSGTAAYQGEVFLDFHAYTPGQFWINNFAHRSIIVTVEAEYNGQSQNLIQYWDYPQGGSPIDSFSKFLSAPYGVAVSLKPS